MRSSGIFMALGLVASLGCSGTDETTGIDLVSIQVSDPESFGGGCGDAPPPTPDAGWPDAGPPTCGGTGRAGFKASIDNSDENEHLVEVVQVEILDASGGLVQALDVLSAERDQGGAFDGRVPAHSTLTIVYDLDASSYADLFGELHFKIVFSVDGVERTLESATFIHTLPA